MKQSIPGEFFREGLTAVINLKMKDPEFTSQTKERLGNSKIKSIIDSISFNSLHDFFSWHPKVLSAVLDRAQQAHSDSQILKAAKENVSIIQLIKFLHNILRFFL